jgi:hypothetical protein
MGSSCHDYPTNFVDGTPHVHPIYAKITPSGLNQRLSARYLAQGIGRFRRINSATRLIMFASASHVILTEDNRVFEFEINGIRGFSGHGVREQSMVGQERFGRENGFKVILVRAVALPSNGR